MSSRPSPTAVPPPDLSVIVPVRNDARHVAACLDSILEQNTGGKSLEILVVDGGSIDGTEAIVRQRAAADTRIRLLHNAAGMVSPALNIGLGAARGRVLIRMDAHALYEPDYILASLEHLETTGAAAVGGIQRPVPGAGTAVARAIAAVQESPLGLGGGAHRRPGYSGPARTLWLGAFHRDLPRRVGGFDEALYRSEDNDFYQRVRAAGGVLHLSSRIRASYVCRATLRDLWRQSWATGSEILPTLARNHRAMSMRHLAPGAAAAAGCMLLATVPVIPVAGIFLLGAASAYMVLTSLAAAAAARRGGAVLFVPAMAALATLHGAYALGTLYGLTKVPGAGRRAPRPTATSSAPPA